MNEKTLPPQTHCFELIRLAMQGIKAKWDELDYTVDGIRGVFADPYDGQRYEITIRPVKEQDNGQRP